MTFRQFNGIFRPLVERAWLAQCNLTGAAPNNRTAKDTWYREQIYSATGGRLRSTRDAGQRELHVLLDRFQLLCSTSPMPHVTGWSDAQNSRFADLAESAWQHLCRDGYQGDFSSWLDESILLPAGLSNRHADDRKDSFDTVMAHLAVIANDDYWISRTAEAAEIRMRYQIFRFCEDLSWLEKQTISRTYVQAIWSQAKLSPGDIQDAPAEALRKLLAILDTHIRRLCRDYQIDPSALPSRSCTAPRPIAIREENHHLHVGHALEHCPPVAVVEDAPF